MTTTTNSPLTKSYITISTPDIRNDVITFVPEGQEPIKVTFDFKNCKPNIKTKLRRDVFLTENNKLFHLLLLQELPIPTGLIHSIMVEQVLAPCLATDRRSNKVVSLKKSTSQRIYLKKFVTLPGHKNIFFVTDFNHDDMSLVCVEVHPSKALTFGLSLLNASQVALTQWKGPHLNNDEVLKAFKDFKGFTMKVDELNDPDFDFRK